MNSNAYALLIGINKFSDNELSELRYAEKDCEDMYQILTDRNIGLFPEENVIKLLGEEATTDNVETALFKQVVADKSSKDLVLVYIAGHGFEIPGLEKAYLATHDVSKRKVEQNPREGLHMDFLHEEIFRKSKAGTIIFLVDACLSGPFVPSSSRDSKSKPLIDNKFYSTESGRTALFSCTHDGQSHETPDLKNGVFTHYLLEGLKGGAVEPDKNEITMDSLSAYVRQKTPPDQQPIRYGQDCGRVVLAKSFNSHKELHAYTVKSDGQLIDGDDRLDFAPLSNMIESYKPFIDKLTGLLGDDTPIAGYDAEKRILEAVRISSRAEFAFLLRVDQEGLIPKALSNTSARSISEKEYLDDTIMKLPVADVISKGNDFSSDYKGLFTIYDKDKKKPKTNLVIPLWTKRPCEFIVVCGLSKNPLFLDRTYAEILSALYTASHGLISINTLQIEAAILDRLKHAHRYLPDSFYNRRFALFKKRLHNMIVHFQPILCLDRVAPYICSYEALARDPDNNRAPCDLFGAAELWGRQFIIELDSYFLKAAVESYSEALANTRREAILDLSVNVYPDSLVQDSYSHALTEVVNRGLIPPNRLFLEISEKFPLPVPESIEGRGQNTGACSFREILECYVADLHIGFGIDDFGVGHASLASLLRLHPNYVKIDREILKHESVYDALNFTLALTKALTWKKYLASSKFVIEGYDSNISQRVLLHRLYDLGIRYVQGHFYGNSGPDLYRLDKEMKTYLTSLIKGESNSARHKDAVYIQ